MEIKIFESSEKNVWKYVFKLEKAIAEAVLYRYESFQKRTVICCSVQSGCPVGCSFCGTGKRFIRNLTTYEIVEQVRRIVRNIETQNGIMSLNSFCEKFQIMFMSMGEPMLNFENVKDAIIELNKLYPNAQLLLSTVGINKPEVLGELVQLSKTISKVGLQFSIHQAFEEKRNVLIPYKNKLTLREIRDWGMVWHLATGRPVFLNYCIDGNNISDDEISVLKDLFSPAIFNFTFSVICSADETMRDAGYRNHETIQQVMGVFVEDGYNVRMFDPAGQDDIGGGCGQLWYVQEYLKSLK